MPRSDRANPSLWSRFDERAPAAGRVRAWVFLTHPGPSLLVTALLVAATWLLLRHAPAPRTSAGLVLAMLPAQLGIGALNDWADWRVDAYDKPYKPIVRGLVPRRAALAFATGAFVLSAAATVTLLGPLYLVLDAVAIGAGAVYDLGLKRTRFAVLAWWGGFATLPIWAMEVAGRVRGVAAVVPLAGLLALALLLANALPDIEGDRAGGARTLAAALGHRRARAVLSCTLAAAAVIVAVMVVATGQGSVALVGAAVLAAGAVVPFSGQRATRAVFPVLALAAAVASASWLAAVPPQ